MAGFSFRAVFAPAHQFFPVRAAHILLDKAARAFNDPLDDRGMRNPAEVALDDDGPPAGQVRFGHGKQEVIRPVAQHRGPVLIANSQPIKEGFLPEILGLHRDIQLGAQFPGEPGLPAAGESGDDDEKRLLPFLFHINIAAGSR